MLCAREGNSGAGVANASFLVEIRRAEVNERNEGTHSP